MHEMEQSAHDSAPDLALVQEIVDHGDPQASGTDIWECIPITASACMALA